MSYRRLREFFNNSALSNDGYNTAITSTTDCYGFELELEFDDSDIAVEHCDNFYSSVSGELLNISADGSLDEESSFELQTDVLSYSDMMEFINQDLDVVLKHIDEDELTSNKSVGLHISLSFANVERQYRWKAIQNFFYLVNFNKTEWEFLSKRSDGGYYDYDCDIEDLEKYRSVNLSNANILQNEVWGSYGKGECDGRVEVRTFWRSVDPTVLSGSISAVHAAKLFSVESAQSDNPPQMSWSNFMEWINANKNKFHSSISMVEELTV